MTINHFKEKLDNPKIKIRLGILNLKILYLKIFRKFPHFYSNYIIGSLKPTQKKVS